jgi:hypothetical protein
MRLSDAERSMYIVQYCDADPTYCTTQMMFPLLAKYISALVPISHLPLLPNHQFTA